MSIDFSPNTRSCMNCGAGVTGSICQVCGFVQIDTDGFGADITLDRMHAFTTNQGVVSVVYPMSPGDGFERYLVEDAEGTRYELLAFADQAAHERCRVLRSELGAMMRAPTYPATPGRQPLELFSHEGVRNLSTVIAEAVAEKGQNDALDLIERWMRPLVECVAVLHEAGFFLQGAGPEAFIFDNEGRCFISANAQVARISEAESSQIRSVHDGFAAPEIYGRCGGQLTPRTDVYFLGTVLYCLLARRGPLKECAARVEPLPIPRLYHHDVPPMLSAVALRATAVAPHHRYHSAREMENALTNAVRTAEERAGMGLRTLDVDIGQEIHIGLIKGLYSPVNQDNYFMHMDELSGVGIFFVTDGVSISHFGTGDVASRCVSDAARALSEQMRNSQSVGVADDTLMIEQQEMTLVDNPLPDESSGRFQLLCQVLDDANARIGHLVAPELPASLETPPGIMAATAVGLLLEKNRASFTFIGDSRIYLIRDGHIAQLSIDHNLKTQLMRNGRSPTMARQVPGANALVQCVGEFERSPEMDLVPVPMQPEYAEVMLLPGDRLILCSDGVTDYVGFEETESERLMLDIVESAPNARTAAFDLMVAANRGGGGDNICCIVLAFDAPDTSEMSL